jgi:hypothetical protein
MKSILKTVFLALVIAVFCPMPDAFVQAGAESRKPLMVIRFNGPFVEYSQSLNMAVVAAVKAKQTVIFDVVAGRQVQAMGNQVAREIVAMGVNPNKVTLSGSGINNNEVLIFVR